VTTPQALAYYQRSQQIAEEIGDKAAAAYTLNNIGTIEDAQGGYAQALALLRAEPENL